MSIKYRSILNSAKPLYTSQKNMPTYAVEEDVPVKTAEKQTTTEGKATTVRAVGEDPEKKPEKTHLYSNERGSRNPILSSRIKSAMAK